LLGLREKWQKLQDKGSNYSVEIPERTLRECFNEAVERHPDNPYVIYHGKVYTYDECNRASRKMANGLIELGLTKGDRIAFYLANGINFVLACQACFKLGVIIVNANPLDSIREIEARLLDSGAKAAFIDEVSSKAVSIAACNTEGFEVLINCSESPGDRIMAEGISIVDLARLLRENNDTEPKVELHPDEIQVLQYTGGTTGVSKGCCVTHRNYLYNAYGAVEYYSPVVKVDEWSTALGLPMSHAYGFTTAIINNLVAGGSMILADSIRPSLEDILRNIEEYKASIWPAVPVMINTSIHQPDLLAKYDLSSLKCISSGAAPLTLSDIKEFEGITGARLSEGYGLAEAVRTVTSVPFGTYRPGKVGIPFPHMDVLVVDIETGTTVMPTNEYGEIIARSPQITQGYWKKPEETELAFRGGWLYTGDIGYFDEEGMLAIVGRSKEVILVSGFNVYPKEIDELLGAHPEIVESATIGIPDEKRGEVPKSFVVLKRATKLSEGDIQEFLRNELTGYKVPRVIQFVDAIPKTKANKTDKAKLKQM
jgi:long-chain acyl-CoA synthetase